MSMEARLFVISIWCGVYGQILRLSFKKGSLSENRWFITVIDAFFWGTAAAMVGMLVASYSERIEETNRLSAIFAFVGVIAGAVAGYVRSKTQEKRQALLRDNLEWADTGFSAILLAAFVMFFILQAFKIPSGSMRMTFVEGDHLFVNKFIYGLPIPLTEKKVLPLKKITQGDIVIFRFPARGREDAHYGKDFIKRAVALGGQTVEIINKQLYVDGKLIHEPYKQTVDKTIYQGIEGLTAADYQRMWESGAFSSEGGNDVRDNFGPVVVPENYVFVMGDNRDRSFDSRFWGPLRQSAVKGKAWLLYLPFNRIRLVK